MSALQARQAALELQQELVELDIDVELQLKPIKRNMGARGHLMLETAVLELDVGLGPKHPATIYIDEDGVVWGDGKAGWGSIFGSTQLAFNTTDPWNPAKLAASVKAAMPTIKAIRATSQALLTKFRLIRK
jgi:hypothetical protein